MKKKEQKTPFDNIKIKKLTEADRERVLKETDEITKRHREGPPPPGDREIAAGARAEILNEKCVVCKSSLEQIWQIKFPHNDIIGPAGRGHWVPDGCRCTNCKLVYDKR